MAAVWAAVAVTRDVSGAITSELVLPADQELSILNGKEPMLLVTVPWRDRAPYNDLKTRTEVWYGWRDGGNWVDDNELFGGYIKRVKGKKVAGEMEYPISLEGYDCLFDRTTVRGFPTDPIYRDPFADPPLLRLYHIPVSSTDPKLDGYPVGYTPKDWIAAKKDEPTTDAKPFNGLVTTFVPDVIIGTVDAPFAYDLLDITSRPTNTAVMGLLQGLTLRTAIEVVIDRAKTLRPSLKPWYTLRPRASGTSVVPEFNLRDLSDISTADWFFSDADDATVRWSPTDPPGTVYSYFSDFEVEKDGSELRTRVDVFGVGSDIVSGGENLWRRVVVSVSDNLDVYATSYQAIPGWAGEPVMTQLTTIDGVQAVGNMILDALKEEKITVNYTAYPPVKKGDVVSLNDSSTGVVGLFPVMDVSASGVLREYHITAGREQPTISEILNSARLRLITLVEQGIIRNNGAGPNFLRSGESAADRTIGMVPNSNYQNALAAQSDGIVAMRVRGATNRTRRTPDDEPLAENRFEGPHQYANYEEPLPEVTTTRPVLGTPPYLFPMPRYLTRDEETGAMLEWDRQDGTNGPWHQHFRFDEDGEDDVYYPTMALIARVKIVREYTADNVRVDPTGTVSLLLENLTSHIMEPVTPPVMGSTPLYLKAEVDQALLVKVEGMASGNWCKVEVTEAGINPAFFGL